MAIAVVGSAALFVIVMDIRYEKIKKLGNKFKYGKEKQAEKPEETKKAGRINARGKW